MDKTQKYFLGLIKSTLNNSEVPEKPADVSFEDLYRISKSHCVEAMTFRAVRQLHEKPDSELLNKWQAAYHEALGMCLTQNAEFNKIKKAFTEKSIHFLPVKGMLIRPLYPHIEDRQMSDLDILFHPEDADEIREILEQMDYEVKMFGTYRTDNYFLEPYVTIEMHRMLVSEENIFYEYFKNIWDRVISASETAEAELKTEDQYMFILAHFYNHYHSAGSGIRSLADIYVWNRNYPHMDQKYLETESNKMDLNSFRKDCEQLAEAVFGSGNMTKHQENMLGYILDSGVFGTFEQWAEHRRLREIKKAGGIITGRGRYFFNRLFPTSREMISIYPILKNKPILMPVFWIYRPLEALATKPKRIKTELRTFFKSMKRNGEKH